MQPRFKGADQKKKQLLLDGLSRQFKQAYALGRYEQALQFALQASRVAPQMAVCRSDAAVCLVKLERWTAAIEQAQMALALGPASLATLDALAHAHGGLDQWDAVQQWGLQALKARHQQFSLAPPIQIPEPGLPPPPSAATQHLNIIAFSLFGDSPKYGETAVINAQERERLYPHWTCHFYVDASVPVHVLQRLESSGSRVFHVGAQQQAWPGPMWRFLAYDTPEVHRVVFRDADSVISEREAGAVAQWILSGHRFHHMRDAATHTELLLAGLWGCVGGALPPMHRLMEQFMKKPVASRHFADQFFLRELVWPYARESLLQHDSVFGFMDPQPFPDGPRQHDFHVGCAEGAALIEIKTDHPDGTAVLWTLYGCEPQAPAICTYPAVCSSGSIRTHLPGRWARALAAGKMQVRTRLADPAA
jgi:hypothetical protein